MTEPIDFVYQPEDLIAVEGRDGTWTVKGSSGVVRQPPNNYQIQLGRDAATTAFVTPEKMTLVERPKPKDDKFGPRLIPKRGIMDY